MTRRLPALPGDPLTTDDLRHPLMAHVQYLGNGFHRHVASISGTDRLVPLFSQLFALLL
jgi:hypothetical protein